MTPHDDMKLVLGEIRAYRWWTLAAPDLEANPFRAEGGWEPGWLEGMQGEWRPGVNEAACKAGWRPPSEDHGPVPGAQCSCGFWAYWHPQAHDLGRTGRLPVFGAIAASGEVIIAEHGLRASHARIEALHLPIVISPRMPASPASPPVPGRLQYGPHNPWWNHPKFTGRVIQYGRQYENAPLWPSPAVLPPPDERELAEAAQRGEAWTAVIGDQLAQLYPDADVCETRNLLVARYPPDPSYGNMPLCPWCHQAGLPYGHEFSCQANPWRTA